MITFLVCLALLVGAYFTYGRYLARLAGIDRARPVPSETRYDGVDYVPLPGWKIFLIQLLNIAGLGPIFGAVLGAAYGPVAFVWITLGGVLMGGMHDFFSGVLSMRHGGESLPGLVGRYLGKGVRGVMSLFTVVLLVLVGAVFLSQPAEMIAARIEMPALSGIAFGDFSWLLLAVLGAILLYYVLATLLPVDRIIGRLYPVFGVTLLVMALGILVVLLLHPGRYPIPELTTLHNFHADAARFPIMPMLFTTIACGAISGFHATQSPLMARCITSEQQCRPIFYGAMIAESLIALIWAAIGMAFWGGPEGLNNALADAGGAAGVLVDHIAQGTLPPWLATLVVAGVIACAVTSGDTAFRSARLMVADLTGIGQRSIGRRLLISLPLFGAGLLLIGCLPFGAIWNYFAWANQALATVTLWAVTVWLARCGKTLLPALVPALAMTYVSMSYIFVSPLMYGMQNRVAAYALGGAATCAVFAWMVFKLRDNDKAYAQTHARPDL